jgi:hypothetical protein
VVLLQPNLLIEVAGGTLVIDAGNLGGGAVGVQVIFTGYGFCTQLGLVSLQDSSRSAGTATFVGPDNQIMKSPRRIKIKGTLSKIHAAVSPRV